MSHAGFLCACLSVCALCGAADLGVVTVAHRRFLLRSIQRFKVALDNHYHELEQQARSPRKATREALSRQLAATDSTACVLL